MFHIHSRQLAEEAYIQQSLSANLAEGDIRRLRHELAGAEYELMHVKPEAVGQREHNLQLTKHVGNQHTHIYIYMYHLESVLAQSQTQKRLQQ